MALRQQRRQQQEAEGAWLGVNIAHRSAQMMQLLPGVEACTFHFLSRSATSPAADSLLLCPLSRWCLLYAPVEPTERVSLHLLLLLQGLEGQSLQPGRKRKRSSMGPMAAAAAAAGDGCGSAGVQRGAQVGTQLLPAHQWS